MGRSLFAASPLDGAALSARAVSLMYRLCVHLVVKVLPPLVKLHAATFPSNPTSATVQHEETGQIASLKITEHEELPYPRQHALDIYDEQADKSLDFANPLSCSPFTRLNQPSQLARRHWRVDRDFRR